MDMSQSMGENLAVGRGAAAGAVAWIGGIVLTYLSGMLELNETATFLIELAGIDAALSLFFNAHWWFMPGAEGFSDIALLTLIPVIVLLIAGVVTASQGRTDGPGAGFAQGASVTAGYLGLLILTLAYIAITGDSDTGTTTILVGFVTTGVLFPVVFGGIGGVIGDAI